MYCLMQIISIHHSEYYKLGCKVTHKYLLCPIFANKK